METYIKLILSKVKKSSWKTTLIGLLLILSAITTVFLKITTWIDSMPLLVIGIGFLFAEDSKVEKK